MTPMEITLLVIGVIIFIASFFIKDRKAVKSERDIEEEQRQIRKLMEHELDDMKSRVNDATDETVEYAMEKAERSLEKLSNEKIMAVSDYSNMVMEEIDKNHKEVMFLYDMLSDKQVDVNNSARKVEATVREAENFSNEAISSTEEFRKNLDDYSNRKLEEVRQAAESVTDSVTAAAPAGYDEAGRPYAPYVPPRVDRPMTAIDMLKARQSEADIKPVFNTLNTDSFKSIEASEVTLMNPEDVLRPMTFGENGSGFDSATGMVDTIQDDVVQQEPKKQSSFMKGFGSGKANNNQKIIELHEQGKSTVEIAKELNLGVGEVKLVIDLFK
ncbi:MAG: hypothetical protein IJR19_06320 [Lachnospiraceae bacterium]|nr:hypothetical protein [Lachnospiraceae bacterium]MBQ7260956.1 hypothetical protein [Lachnospiraceae bacterium]